MVSNYTARAAAEFARPQFGPVTEAIFTMRAAHIHREAFASLQAALLRRLVDDLTTLDLLGAVAVRLAGR